jgi:hypothetical protein
MHNNDKQVDEIVRRLHGDNVIDFKREVSGYLREGVCPSCGKRELYISTNQPWMIKCGRENNCGHQESTRDLYPEIFEEFKKRFPKTEKNPNATADAYLSVNRGFDLARLKGEYQQATYHHTKSGVYAEVVRFPLWDGQFWDRIIEKDDAEKMGIKAHFNYGFKTKGKAWHPKGMKFYAGDTVYIVEGVFHAIGLNQAGFKAVAAFASTMFPWILVEDNPKVNWVLAYDDDPAGRKYMAKYIKQLGNKKIKCQVALTGQKESDVAKKDWDDLFRENKLTPDFMAECLYRGKLFTASSISEKAYHWYCKNERYSTILDFNNKLFQIIIGDKFKDDLTELANKSNNKDDNKNTEQQGGDAHLQVDIEESQDTSKQVAPARVTWREMLDSNDGRDKFFSYVECKPISNCFPQFLYCENDKLTDEIAYYFSISFPQAEDRQIALTGSALESPASFNKALLNKAAGATFDGNAFQLKVIRDRWFNQGITHVQTVPFIGYDKSSGIYVYSKFAYFQGRELKINKHNYFSGNKTKIKTSFKSVQITTNKQFDNSWIGDFHKVFSWNGLVALSFWTGSLFAEQIRAELAAFPFLEMSGLPGTGKSTILEYMWKLNGRDEYEGFDPSKATFAARARAFIQMANMPVVLIEGDRESKNAKKGAFDYNELKTAYNGRAVRSMGAFNRGNDIEEPPFRGSLIIAQNAEVDADAAILERIVHLHFTKAHFTLETKTLARKFEQADSKKASGFLNAALTREKDILATFFDRFEHWENHYTQMDVLKNQRIIKNHAMVMAMADAMRSSLFPKIPQATQDKLGDFIHQRAVDREKRLVADHPMVQQFWDAYEIIGSSKKTGDGDLYTEPGNILNHHRKPDLIAIHLSHYYMECSQRRLETIPQSVLKPLLISSRHYKYVDVTTVNSSRMDKRLHCWVFEKPLDSD